MTLPVSKIVLIKFSSGVAAECPGFAMMDPIPFGFINWTSQGIADPSFSQEERFHIYDAKVTYICDSGDSVVGSAERTCQANGTWSGLVPYCQGNCSM